MQSLWISLLGEELSGSVFPEAVSPSEQTYSKIEEASGVSKPNLRYGPGEWGNANKESPLPVNGSSLASLFLLGLVLTGFRCFKHEQSLRLIDNKK